MGCLQQLSRDYPQRMLHSNNKQYNKQCIQGGTQFDINKQQSMGNYEQKWIDIRRVWSLSAQQFVPALHV